VSLAINEDEGITARDTSVLETTDRLLNNEPTKEVVAVKKPEKKKKKHKDYDKYEKLMTPDDLDRYTYNIPYIDIKSDKIIGKKFRYVMHEALSDLGLYNAKSVVFWITSLVLLTMIWIRAYTHTFGSWIILRIAGVSNDEFEPRLYFC